MLPPGLKRGPLSGERAGTRLVGEELRWTSPATGTRRLQAAAIEFPLWSGRNETGSVGPLPGTSELALRVSVNNNIIVLGFFSLFFGAPKSPNERRLSPPLVENEDLHSHVCFRDPRSHYLVLCTLPFFLCFCSFCVFASVDIITNVAGKIHAR